MIERETLTDHWWATGDMPVQNVPSLAFLIDGRMTMLEMCLSFLGARHSIYITAFGLSPELLLVRGKHKCAGPTGSSEQEELHAWLRILLMAEHLGLTDEDILFRFLEVLGRVRLPDDHVKSEKFTHSIRRWLRQRRHPKDSLFASTRSSLAAEQLTGELGTLWEELDSLLGDPLSGLALFAKQAKENLLTVKAGQPLVGHLLPYIPHDRAQDYEVELHAVNGWLDTFATPQVDSASTQ
jgi:hypothetical protein